MVARGWGRSQSIPEEGRKLRILIPAAPSCHTTTNTWGYAHTPLPSPVIGCVFKYPAACAVIGSNVAQVIS